MLSLSQNISGNIPHIKNVRRKNSINNKRLNNAINMLNQIEFNISEIAFSIGYNDPRYFSKCFKDEYGVTPSEYRQMFIEMNKKAEIDLNKKFIERVNVIIDDNLNNETFCMDIFASEMYVSKASLYRKFKSHTGLSPIEYIRNYKIRYAKRLIERKYNIVEILETIGFNDEKYFIKCFRKETGLTPTQYIKTLN